MTKLFHIVEPDAAFFGKKDYQQWRVIQRMVRRCREGREGRLDAEGRGDTWACMAWHGMELACSWQSIRFAPRHAVPGHASTCYVSSHASWSIFMPCLPRRHGLVAPRSCHANLLACRLLTDSTAAPSPHSQVRDLDMAIDVVGMPICREADGLAMSRCADPI